MHSTREIKRRIRGVKSTQQITRAMEMVAAAKLRRTQEKLYAARPYAELLRESIARIVAYSPGVDHPLLREREIKRQAFLVVGSDLGLNGGYNSNLLRFAIRKMPSRERVGIVAMGRKVQDHFTREKYNLLAAHPAAADLPSPQRAGSMAASLLQLFLQEEADQVDLVYNHFVNPLVQRPRLIRLIPVVSPGAEELPREKEPLYYRYEPDARAVLEVLLPRYVQSNIYHALLEAKASEQGARMTAMSNATDNAAEMIGKLTLSYNRARQAVITRELLEIVVGAEALRRG